MVLTVNEKGYHAMRWDSLASLPLFIGMSQKELESIMTQSRIDFNKVEAGTVIAKRNQPCGKLTIAVSGELLCQTFSDDNSYKIEENVSAPIILQSLGIFGKYQVFTNTIKAITQTNTITFEKDELHRLLDTSLIFRINLIRILATQLQKREQQLWAQQYHPKGKTLSEQNNDLLVYHIKQFIKRRCITPAGRKVLYINMTTLGALLGQNRQQISKAINSLKQEGLLTSSRGKIVIPQLQNL